MADDLIFFMRIFYLKKISGWEVGGAKRQEEGGR